MKICQTDGTCPEHGPYIWYCNECHDIWAKANPLTAAAIRGGKSGAAVSRARRLDEANREAAT